MEILFQNYLMWGKRCYIRAIVYKFTDTWKREERDSTCVSLNEDFPLIQQIDTLGNKLIEKLNQNDFHNYITYEVREGWERLILRV